MNFIAGELAERTAEGAVIRLTGGGSVTTAVVTDGISAGTPLTLGIRPEHVRITAADGGRAHRDDPARREPRRPPILTSIASSRTAAACSPRSTAHPAREGQDRRLRAPHRRVPTCSTPTAARVDRKA